MSLTDKCQDSGRELPRLFPSSSSSSQGCGVGRSAQAWLSRAIQSLSPKLARKFQQSPSSASARRASCSRAPSSESLLKAPAVHKKRSGSAARPSSLPCDELKRTGGVSKQRKCNASAAPVADGEPPSCSLVDTTSAAGHKLIAKQLM